MKKLVLILSLVVGILSARVSISKDEVLFNSLRTLENHDLKVLLKNGVSLEPLKGESPLLYIRLDFNFLSKVKLLLKAGVNTEYINKDGKSIVELFKRRYQRYDKLYTQIEKLSPQEIQNLEIPAYYKHKVLEKKGKKSVLRSIDKQKYFIKKAIELIKK